MKAPVDLSVIQQDEASKWAVALESSVRQPTEMRHTVTFRIKSALCSMMDAPHATCTLISLTPMVAIEEPLTPFTE